MRNSYVAIPNLNFETVGLPSVNKIYVNEHLIAFISKLAYQCRLMYEAGLMLSTKVVNGVQWMIIEHKNGRKKYVSEYDINDDYNNVLLQILNNSPY